MKEKFTSTNIPKHYKKCTMTQETLETPFTTSKLRYYYQLLIEYLVLHLE